MQDGERWCVKKLGVKNGVCQSGVKDQRWCVTKRCVKNGVTKWCVTKVRQKWCWATIVSERGYVNVKDGV